MYFRIFHLCPNLNINESSLNFIFWEKLSSKDDENDKPPRPNPHNCLMAYSNSTTLLKVQIKKSTIYLSNFPMRLKFK